VVERFGTDPGRLLAMPVRLFWSMTSAVERLEAASMLAQFDVAVTAQAGDHAAKNEFREALRHRLGSVSVKQKPVSTKQDIMAAFVELEG
jgi:hypothetical protein